MIESYFNKLERPHWFIETHYNDYQKFLNLFDLKYNHHVDFGGSKMNYKWDYSYPKTEVDLDEDYLKFIESAIQGYPVKNYKCVSSWWIDYPTGSYSVAHRHVKGKRFTAVMFLTDKPINEEFPHAGNLYAFPDSVRYREWAPIAGDVIIMDGDIYHGTYPTLNERKVFVVDYEFE